jgi:hypothetical protein
MAASPIGTNGLRVVGDPEAIRVLSPDTVTMRNLTAKRPFARRTTRWIQVQGPDSLNLERYYIVPECANPVKELTKRDAPQRLECRPGSLKCDHNARRRL